MTTPWYAVDNAAEISSPALLVYPDRIEHNVRRMIAAVGDVKRLRPHIKTHKMAEVIRLQLEAGIEKFKCATIAEAELLAKTGAPDVLLAYQLVGPDVDRLSRLAAKYPSTRFATIVDDAKAIERLGRACAAAGVEVECLVDLDVGMRRTGIAPGDDAETLYRRIGSTTGLVAGGLHAYDGHIKILDPDERATQADAAHASVERLRARLEAAGMSVPRVVAGGTPTFPAHARRGNVECSPGTCTLWDWGYASKFPDLAFLNAAVLLTRVISKPTGQRLCLDLGYKAVAPDNPDPRAVFFELPDAVAVIHNEEHLTVETALAERFSVGDVLYGVPYHVCPTCALHREAVVVEGGQAVARWAVAARDRQLEI